MFTAYVVAAIIAALAGYGATDMDRLEYWQRWDPASARSALGFLYGVYGVTGIAVAALAEHVGWHVLDAGAARAVANGAAYGIAAFILLRLDVASFGLSTVSPARVVSNLLLKRLHRRLDAATDRQVPRRVGELTAAQLCQVSWQLFLRHVVQEVEPDVALTHATWLRQLHATARDPNPTRDSTRDLEVFRAQESLRYYIERLIVEHEDATIDIRES